MIYHFTSTGIAVIKWTITSGGKNEVILNPFTLFVGTLNHNATFGNNLAVSQNVTNGVTI